ncbi:MAG: hypothetical protein LC792_30065 [Actinobacteria bacterium]|nr:hypothetical protein [Actinomycetota bacterium]
MNLNVTSAAEACKVRRQVIEKALKNGQFPNAFYSGESKRGVWMIPVDDLRAAGLEPDGQWLKRRDRSVRKLSPE